MIEEPKGNSAEDEVSIPTEEPEEKSMPRGRSPASSLKSLVAGGLSSEYRFGSLFISVSDFFHWIATGKVRTSIAAGAFAGLIVALGFMLFDLGREEWMLKQKYPNALHSYERHVLYARDLVLEKQYQKAEPILRKLVRNRGGTSLHSDALLLLGECLDKSAQDTAASNMARGIYERFINEYPADPRVPSVHLPLAENFARNELYSGSNAQYERYLRMVPDADRRDEIEFLIARNHYLEANLRKAVDSFEQVRQKYPGTTAAYDSTLLLAKAFDEFGKPDNAARVLNELIDEAPSTPHAAAALRMLAKNALDDGAYKDAIEYCTQWLGESPLVQHQVDVMLTLGLAKLGAGAPTDAMVVASEITTFFPDSPRLAEAIVVRGRSLEALGQLEEAESSYIDATRIAPDHPSPHEHLARLYQKEGNFPKAIQQMKYACEDDPRNDALFIELAKLYRLNAENVSALAVLNGFIRERQLSIHIGEAYLMVTGIKLDMDRPHDAYRTLDRLLATGTATVKQSAVFEKQANILAQVGLYDDAIETYRLALEAGASAVAITPGIAKTLLADGRPQECLDELASIKASALLPSDRFNLLELKARAYLELEKFADARRSIQEAIALRTGREKFSTLALLMQANLALLNEDAASKVFEITLKFVKTDEAEAPPEARRIILDWARYLYEKGEYAQAAKVYAGVDAVRFPAADVAWAIYQEGNCYYHMGDYGKAGDRYARLEDKFSDSEWVGFAEQKGELMSLKGGA